MILKALEMLAGWRLFRRVRPPERALDIIRWWESRRIPYNLIVAVVGIASGLIMLMTELATEHVTGEALDATRSPLFEIFAVIIFAMMANICFTGGWILELLSRRLWGTRAEAFGEIAFTWGTLGSIFLTLVPAALTVVAGTYRILGTVLKN